MGNTLSSNENFEAADPCSAYKTLNEWQRSVRNSKLSPPLCDSFLQKGWYRVTSLAGENMPTSCPMNGMRCGTIEPIWLNGTYPNAGQISNVTACSSHFNGDCCKSLYEMQVKNCSGYYVYNLGPTASCPQAYCFGQELPCPTGETSNTGFSPGCKYEPCLRVNHKPLDKWQRSFGNNDTAETICDSFLVKGWYRPISKAGNLMSTTCPKDGFRCGTIEPIWLNGTLPKVANRTMHGTACVSTYRGGCCAEVYDIQVRNCGKYNIYNLINTRKCPQAYCFGSEVPCPVGWTSDTGYTPGCEFDPCYFSNHDIIRGQEKRSANYTLKSNDIPFDDSTLKTAWYRIKSQTGNDIVMLKQPMNQCGTKYPIWMKGYLPSVSEKVADRKVCLSGEHDYCQKESDIKVKNCGTFNVYFLTHVSTKDSAYCFGDKPFKDSKPVSNGKIDPKLIPLIVVLGLLVLGVTIAVTVYVIMKKSKKNKIGKKEEKQSTPLNGESKTHNKCFEHG